MKVLLDIVCSSAAHPHYAQLSCACFVSPSPPGSSWLRQSARPEKLLSPRCSRRYEHQNVRSSRRVLFTSQLNDPNSLQPSARQLLHTLKADGTPQQTLALFSLVDLDADVALSLLQQSGVLVSNLPKTRITAVSTLARLGMRPQATLLVEMLRSDSDHSVRAAIASALGTLLGRDFGAAIADVVRDDLFVSSASALQSAATSDVHFIVRYAAIVALGNLADVDAIAFFVDRATDPISPPLERVAAIDALGETVAYDQLRPELLNVLSTQAKHEDEFVRAAVVRCLLAWKDAGDASVLLQQMREDEPRRGNSALVLTTLDADRGFHSR